MINELIQEENLNNISLPKTEEIIVVCALDNNYAMQLAVTIRSAIEHLSENYHLCLFIIDGGIQERSKCRFLASIPSERCTVKWIPKPSELINEKVIPKHITSGVPEIAHITIASWYRLLIPELLPQHLKKAIYLDCDLVITGDLGKLWETNINDNYVLAVARLESYEYRTVPYFLPNWKALGCNKDDKYFNSGVLVFNLEKWRIDNMFNKCLNYIKHSQEYVKYGDQDVLNAMVVGNWAELDPRWNCMNAPKMTKQEVDNAFILHFATLPKPWLTLEAFPAKDAFYKYLSFTDWSSYKYSIEKRLYVILKKIWRKLKRESKKFLLLNN